MYKEIVLGTESGNIYIVKLRNNVGSKKLEQALILSNPGVEVTNLGLYSDKFTIIENSLIVLVSSDVDAHSYVMRLSRIYENSSVIRLDEFSAYSDSYEKKHSDRKAEINNGFMYQGNKFQIDTNSRLNILGKSLQLQLDPSVFEVTWVSDTKDSNGEDIRCTFTRLEFLEFSTSIASHYETIILGKV